MLTVTVGKLRKALDDDTKDPRYIKTIPNKGCRLIASVDVSEDKSKPRTWLAVVAATVLAVVLWLAISDSRRRRL